VRVRRVPTPERAAELLARYGALEPEARVAPGAASADGAGSGGGAG
jgi:hypothetical protein